MGRRMRATALAAALAMSAGVLGAVPAALVTSAPAGAALTGVDLDNGVTATQLAQSLAGAGVTVSDVSYTGASIAAGNFSGAGSGSGSIGFDSGVVLSSGRVAGTDATCGAKGVEGPNVCTDNSTANGTDGDAALTALAGVTTNDAAILDFSFVPQFSTVQFEYVFGSEEYLEYVNSGVNDVFGFFVNGTNCAVIPGTEGTPVSIDTVNTEANSSFFRDNGEATIDTELDGLTTVLECNATVNPGVSNSLRLAIADGGDSLLDSDVFIRSGSLVSGTTITGSLTDGENTGSELTVETGTPVTATSTLAGPNSASATGTVTYTAYGDPSCDGTAFDGGMKTVTAGTVPDSDPFTASESGTYYWRAAYSGDALNNASSTACGVLVQTVSGATSSIEITSEGQPDTVTAGASALRIITVTNPGEGTAGDVSISFTLPPGTTLVRTTPSQGTCGPAVEGSVTCDLGDLAGGASANVRFVISTPTTVPPSGTLTTSATAREGEGDPVGPAESTTSLAAATPGEASGYVPPGGTLSTGGDATFGNNTVASLTLPNTGEGAVVTLTSVPCAPGECFGKTVTFNDFPGYDDPTQPIVFTTLYDKSVRGTGLFSQMFVLKENSAAYEFVPPCTKPGEHKKLARFRYVVGLLVGGHSGIAVPSPCVDAKQVLKNGDLRVETLFTSGDPSVRRR